MADFKKLLKDHMLKSAGYEEGQFDIKKQMAKNTLGGDDLLSTLIREKMGVKKEKGGKSPSREGGEGIGSEAIPVLVAIAKNTMVLPGMARDMKTLSQNIQKLVKLKGGKAATGASDFFRKQKEKAAGKLIPGKTKSPVSAGASKAAPKTGVMDILGNIAGFIGGALIELIKFLFNPMAIIRLLSKLALPALIIGTIFSGIMSGWKKYQETGSFTDAVVSYFGGALEFLTLGLFGENEVKNLLSLLGDVFKPVTDSVSKIFESIKGVFKNIFGDYIKIDEKPADAPAAPQTSMDDSDDAYAKPFVPPTPSSDVANKAGEVSGVMKEAGLPGLPGGLGGDLGSVMDLMAKGDLKGVASQAEAMKQKYPPQAGPKAETPEEQSARNYELNKTLTSKASSAIGVDLPMPAPPSPVMSAPAAAGGSGAAPLTAPSAVSLPKTIEKTSDFKGGGPEPSESSIAGAKSIDDYYNQPRAEPVASPVTKAAEAALAAERSPTVRFADKAESNKLGALQFLKRTLGILPDKDGVYLDMRNGEKKLSEEEVRSRISAAGKDPDKVLGLLKSADGKGKIDLSSGNLNTITGGAVGGGGGGAPPAPSASPAPMTGEPPVSGASLSSASTEVAEAQRMESAADKGSVVNSPTTNNSSSSSGKPSKQTASAYDSDFAQRLAAT